jgi:hypothetical protein
LKGLNITRNNCCKYRHSDRNIQSTTTPLILAQNIILKLNFPLPFVSKISYFISLNFS